MTELLNISVDSCGDTGLNKAVFNQLFFLFHMFERRGYPRRMKFAEQFFAGLIFADFQKIAKSAKNSTPRKKVVLQ